VRTTNSRRQERVLFYTLFPRHPEVGGVSVGGRSLREKSNSSASLTKAPSYNRLSAFSNAFMADSMASKLRFKLSMYASCSLSLNMSQAFSINSSCTRTSSGKLASSGGMLSPRLVKAAQIATKRGSCDSCPFFVRPAVDVLTSFCVAYPRAWQAS